MGVIWTLAREAAEESIAVLWESALVDRNDALAEKIDRRTRFPSCQPS